MWNSECGMLIQTPARHCNGRRNAENMSISCIDFFAGAPSLPFGPADFLFIRKQDKEGKETPRTHA